jgi:hypothetical protein
VIETGYKCDFEGSKLTPDKLKQELFEIIDV